MKILIKSNEGSYLPKQAAVSGSWILAATAAKQITLTSRKRPSVDGLYFLVFINIFWTRDNNCAELSCLLDIGIKNKAMAQQVWILKRVGQRGGLFLPNIRFATVSGKYIYCFLIFTMIPKLFFLGKSRECS